MAFVYRHTHGGGKIDADPTPIRFVIKGMGVSGAATLACLIDRLPDFGDYPIEIHLIDKRGCNGVGVPYSPPRNKPNEIVEAWKTLALTVPADQMLCIIAENQGYKFIPWLRTKYHGKYKMYDFPPRYVFGEFMRDITASKKAAVAAWPNVTLHEHHTASQGAVSINSRQVAIGLNDGTNVVADKLFEAAGHQRSMRLHDLEATPGYYGTLYNLPVDGRLQPQRKAAYEAVIGGGATNILDAVQVAETLGKRQCHYTIVTGGSKALLDLTGTGDCPQSHKTFCHLRDIEQRVTITPGYIDGALIRYNDAHKYFTIPIQMQEKINTLTAANFVNADLWERAITYTGGRYYDKSRDRVSELRSDIFTSSSMAFLNNAGLIERDNNDMPRAAHFSMHIVGSALTISNEDSKYESWSVRNCWATAHREVNQACDNLLRILNMPLALPKANIIPSARSTGPSP